MKKLKRYGVGLLLLPVCYGVTVGLWEVLKKFKNVPEGSFYFLAGLLSYLAFQWAFFKPMRTYIFGHELTHAMAAWLTGGQVKHFRVSKKGGSVSVTKSNFFVALSPYMIPLYALILLAAYFLALTFSPRVGMYWRSFLWLLGGCMGFHMALTAFALRQGQPDLKAMGKFLSAIIIYLGNALVIVLFLGILFPRTVSWKRFVQISSTEALTAVQEVTRGTHVMIEKAVDGARERN